MFKFMLALFVCLGASVFAQELPDAKGKEVVMKTCTVCHGLEPILQAGRDAEEWVDVSEFMETNGARIDPDERDSIIAYLSKYMGPLVNVNAASAEVLAKQLELSAKEAAALVEFRANNGNFKEFADLAKVPGLDAKKLAPFRYRLRFK